MLSLYNWLASSQQCKPREQLGTKLLHSCSVGCNKKGTDQVSSLQTGPHSLPPFYQIMKGYCCLGWMEIPAETHGAASPLWSFSLVVSLVGTRCLMPIIFLGSSICLQKICILISMCWHLQMFLCSQKLRHFTLKLSADISSFCMPYIYFLLAFKLYALRHSSYINLIRTGVKKGWHHTNCLPGILPSVLCR